MDNGLLAIIATLAVAIGTGLTVIAYRHPREFEPFGLILVGLLVCVEIGILVWNAAVLRAWWSIADAKLIEPGKLDQFNAAIDPNYVSMWWGFVILGIVAYLTFLGTLKFWLLKPKSDENRAINK